MIYGSLNKMTIVIGNDSGYTTGYSKESDHEAFSDEVEDGGEKGVQMPMVVK